MIAAMVLPIAPVNSRWWALADRLNGNFNEEIGWPDLVETVAMLRAGLPSEERVRAGYSGGRFRPAGTLNLYGPAYGLPRAICGMNSHWLRGYGDLPPQTLIVVGTPPRVPLEFFLFHAAAA